MSKIYVIEGDPIALQRPRMARGHLYYAQKHEQERIKEKIAEQHAEKPLFCGPLYMYITFYMPFPQHKNKYHTGQYHYIRPDLSNLIKMAEDAGRGILYKDDACISRIEASKIYDPQPRTEFTLEVINEKEW